MLPSVIGVTLTARISRYWRCGKPLPFAWGTKTSDPGLANHGIAYWGTNLKRLIGVKLKYDPTFVFTPPQNQAIAG